MGVHFGVSYLAVLAHDLENIMLGIADHYPSAMDESIYEPLIDDKYTSLGKVEVYPSEKQAKVAVKKHLLQRSHIEIIAQIYALEDTRLSLQEYQFELKSLDNNVLDDQMYQELVDYYEKKISLTKSSIEILQSQLSVLRKQRNQKIVIKYPSELN
ncbi:TPA: hypothetical protein ACN976_003022 [Vibrio campbellii]